MTILICDSGTDKLLSVAPYSDENELEELIAKYPTFIAAQDEPKVILVARQVPVPDTGTLDVLCIDSEGTPIVVEVKLSRNGESRRQVIAQAIDYVSALSQLTVDELNEITDGSLKKALLQFSDTKTADSLFEMRWKACGGNLRSGQVRVVVAVDDPVESLIRIFQFLRQRSSLDVRLLAVEKSSDQSTQTAYVPKLLSYRKASSSDMGWAAVIDVYNRIARNGYNASKGSKDYKYFSPPQWKGKVQDEELHYEFLMGGDKIGIELHYENDQKWVDEFKQLFVSLSEDLKGYFPNHPVEWNPQWDYGQRLAVFYDKSDSPEEIAQGMFRFIELTEPEVNELLGKLK